MKGKICLLLLIFTILLEASQVFNSTPLLSAQVKESTEGYNFFLRLWEHSLRMDTKHRNNLHLEPKTLLLPGDYSMAHLIPQDGTHPLYKHDVKHSQLRMEFILDHLVLELMPSNHPDIASLDGMTKATLSGKPVTIRRDTAGDFFVEGVKVKKTVTFSDDYHIYVLMHPLFNQTQKVREAFNKLHAINVGESLGPPLVIPSGPFNREVRAPAPPPCRNVRPPAPPTAEEKIRFNQEQLQPPPPPIL